MTVCVGIQMVGMISGGGEGQERVIKAGANVAVGMVIPEMFVGRGMNSATNVARGDIWKSCALRHRRWKGRRQRVIGGKRKLRRMLNGMRG